MHYNLKLSDNIKDVTLCNDEEFSVCNICGEINDETVKEVQASVQKAVNSKQDVLPVVIHSAGGDVYAGMCIYSMLKSCKKKIVTILLGKAFSSAAFLFCCGDERYISPNGTLMFHQVRIENLTGEHDIIRREAEEIDRLNKQMFKLISKRCGHEDPNWLYNKCEKIRGEYYFTPKKARRKLLADFIGIPTITLKVSAKWTVTI